MATPIKSSTAMDLSSLSYEDVMGNPSIDVTGATRRRPESTQLLLVDLDSIKSLVDELQKTLNEIRQLRTELSQRPLVTSITLNDLGESRLIVKLPISSIVLHETDEESIARWPETRAYGIGSTLGEAISALKQNIIDLYFDLKNRDPESLGIIAQDTLRVFETHLQVAE